MKVHGCLLTFKPRPVIIKYRFWDLPQSFISSCVSYDQTAASESPVSALCKLRGRAGVTAGPPHLPSRTPSSRASSLLLFDPSLHPLLQVLSGASPALCVVSVRHGGPLWCLFTCQMAFNTHTLFGKTTRPVLAGGGVNWQGLAGRSDGEDQGVVVKIKWNLLCTLSCNPQDSTWIYTVALRCFLYLHNL